MNPLLFKTEWNNVLQFPMFNLEINHKFHQSGGLIIRYKVENWLFMKLQPKIIKGEDDQATLGSQLENCKWCDSH